MTLVPLQAWGGFVEVAAEAKASPKVGLGGIVGVTSFSGTKVRPLWGATDVRYVAAEGGFSPRYYLVGDFDHGLQVGVQAKIFVAANDFAWFHTIVGNTQLSANVAPYVGYKVTAPFGLTAEFQAGPAVAAGVGSPDLRRGFGVADATGLVAVSRNSTTPTAFGTLLNANVGWSF